MIIPGIQPRRRPVIPKGGIMMAATRSMANAPIGAVFCHTMAHLTAEEIREAVAILLIRETPSSFAVTSGSDGRWDLRLSNHSYEYLRERLTGAR